MRVCLEYVYVMQYKVKVPNFFGGDSFAGYNIPFP